MAVVMITGGTGLVGTALSELLVNKGYQVIILTRNPQKYQPTNSISYAGWDTEQQQYSPDIIGRADYIINLAGAGVVEKRWTETRKEEIVTSRTASCDLLVAALQAVPNKVKAVVSASAIGWYGPDKKNSPNKKPFTEEAPADTSFLGDTCLRWEQSIQPVEQLGKRLVILRLGIVLSNRGGALPEFKKPVQFGVAGILGNGKQVLSWIHINDLCRMFLYAIEHAEMSGVYNAVAPETVTNKQLTLQLAEKLKGRFFIPMYVPAFALKVLMGEMSIEVLKSATVSSNKVRKAGFNFSYANMESALAELTGATNQ